MMSKFRKWNLREPKFAKFPGGACPRSPLEARAFGANNYSLFSITWGWNLCTGYIFLDTTDLKFFLPFFLSIARKLNKEK